MEEMIEIVHFPFLEGVVLQLIRFVRVCSNVNDCNRRNTC